MYITTPDGKQHYIFDSAKDVPDILRQYVSPEIADYIEEVFRDYENEIDCLNYELDNANRYSEGVWEDVRDMMVEIRDIADEIRSSQRVDRRKLDYKMKLISDKINRRL